MMFLKVVDKKIILKNMLKESLIFMLSILKRKTKKTLGADTYNQEVVSSPIGKGLANS